MVVAPTPSSGCSCVHPRGMRVLPASAPSLAVCGAGCCQGVSKELVLCLDPCVVSHAKAAVHSNHEAATEQAKWPNLWKKTHISLEEGRTWKTMHKPNKGAALFSVHLPLLQVVHRKPHGNSLKCQDIAPAFTSGGVLCVSALF